MDGFDELPDAVVLVIFNSVSDIKTLLRCRAVSRRFNWLVPQTDSLLLRVDCVISSAGSDFSGDSDDSFLILSFLKSVIKSLHDLVSPTPLPSPPPPQNSPSQILRRFHRVRDLEIELPSGDLRLDKGATVRWRAEFGRSLRSCVILGFRAIRDDGDRTSPRIGSDSAAAAAEEEDFARGLKSRVVWTISALIAASARHFLLREVVREQRALRRLVLNDREGEGSVAMDEAAMEDLRSEIEAEIAGDGDVAAERNRSRTRVPSVRMRMRHVARLELRGGVWAQGATLVVVRPTKDDNSDSAQSHSSSSSASESDDADLATCAFSDGLYGEAVQALLKTRSYILEMNSF